MGLKKLSVTIGISAFNEEANIGALLKALLAQEQVGWKLDEIIVVSDASTDETKNEVVSLGSAKIRLVSGTTRMGQATRQNQIFNLATSEIVVLVNGDVMPGNSKFVSEMIRPLANKNVGLVGAGVEPVGSSTLIGKVLDWHMGWKNRLYSDFPKDNNVYLCHGRARAFSKPLYKKLRWPKIWSEDAYSYLMTKQLGFEFRYTNKAFVYYQSPLNISDHMRQSVRFLTAKRDLVNIFGKGTVVAEYRFPTFWFWRQIALGLTSHPIYSAVYFGLFFLAYLAASTNMSWGGKPAWDPSGSTKRLELTLGERS